MEAVFLEHTYRWLRIEGVLVLVIPFERLHDCAGVLSYHFTALRILCMTNPDPVQYGQVVVWAFAATSEARPSRTISGSFRALASTAASWNCRSCSRVLVRHMLFHPRTKWR
jgi:hypothetical protein